MEERYLRKDGHVCWGVTSMAAIRNDRGHAMYAICQVHDVTERRAAEQRLKESESRVRAIIDNSPAAICLKDTEGRFVVAGRQFETWHRLAPGAALGRTVHDVCAPPVADILTADDRSVLKAGVGMQREMDVTLPDGRPRTLLTMRFPVSGTDGALSGIGVIHTDITERKFAEQRLGAAQEELVRKANYDDLTTLPNRVLFFDRLTQAVLRARREQEKVVLLFIDLDHFKTINDTLGHAAGDALLRATASRLKLCVREEDTVARLGGDEFTVILPSIASSDAAAVVAEKIVSAFRRPFDLDGYEVFTTASIGITVYPEDGPDAETLVKNADAAMYSAKDSGRSGYHFYTRAIYDQAMTAMRMESRLRSARENGEFSLVYQPVVGAEDGRVRTVETLLRWNNAEFGNVPPDQFIPLAEERGLITDIGAWVLDTACREFASWTSDLAAPVRLAVNMSSRQLRLPNIVGLVRDALERSGLPPQRLELEITERVVMEDVPETVATLNTLTEMGIHLSIDDFGTGYSSLSYLKRLPFSCLKIDRAFVNDVTTSADDATLAKTIINMGHSLGLTVTGEGVETNDQLALLKEYGCDLVQGYHVSRPLPGEQCAAFLRRTNGTRSGRL